MLGNQTEIQLWTLEMTPIGFQCDRLVWIPVSILLHSGRPEVLILREMVVDDGGYVGLVGVGGRNLGP